jgi:hypothetical protein
MKKAWPTFVVAGMILVVTGWTLVMTGQWGPAKRGGETIVPTATLRMPNSEAARLACMNLLGDAALLDVLNEASSVQKTHGFDKWDLKIMPSYLDNEVHINFSFRHWDIDSGVGRDRNTALISGYEKYLRKNFGQHIIGQYAFTGR